MSVDEYGDYVGHEDIKEVKEICDDQKIREMVTNNRWSDILEPISEWLDNPFELDAEQMNLSLRATSGELIIGWYQPSMGRISSITYWKPDGGLTGTDGELEWNENVTTLIQSIDNEKIFSFLMHIEQPEAQSFL